MLPAPTRTPLPSSIVVELVYAYNPCPLKRLCLHVRNLDLLALLLLLLLELLLLELALLFP